MMTYILEDYYADTLAEDGCYEDNLEFARRYGQGESSAQHLSDYLFSNRVSKIEGCVREYNHWQEENLMEFHSKEGLECGVAHKCSNGLTVFRHMILARKKGLNKVVFLSK